MASRLTLRSNVLQRNIHLTTITTTPIVTVAKTLKDNLGAAAANVKAKELPSMLRIAALKDPVVRSMIPLLGSVIKFKSIF